MSNKTKRKCVMKKIVTKNLVGPSLKQKIQYFCVLAHIFRYFLNFLQAVFAQNDTNS
jgi:hypothetical protein